MHCNMELNKGSPWVAVFLPEDVNVIRRHERDEEMKFNYFSQNCDASSYRK